MNLDLSIVIVNWNTTTLLEACLNSIVEQTKKFSYEIIVVDNGSADKSVEMVKQKFPHVKLIANKDNLGFTKANNQGFKIATGTYVLMLNSDTVVKSESLDKMMVFTQQRTDAGIVGCKLRYPNGDFQNSCFRFPDLISIFLIGTFLPMLFPKNKLLNRDRYGMREWDTIHAVDCVMGSCILIKNELLQKVNCLDESYFMFCEETDLCMKVKKQGLKVLYYPEAYIIHVGGGSSKNWAGTAWSYNAVNRGVLFFLAKWHSASTAWLANLIILVFSIPRFFLWGSLDIVDSVREKKKFTAKRLLKFYTYTYNLKALFNPNKFREAWGGRKLK
jgi:GT2 family glycosyltransferase